MRTRTLPPDEWHRLSDTDIPSVLPYVSPDQFEVVVVEDNGEIVGAWAVWRVVHVEGLWIAPAHRGKGSVAKRLYHATMEAAKKWTPEWVMTMAPNPHVRSLVEHIGGVPIPGETFVFSVKES